MIQLIFMTSLYRIKFNGYFTQCNEILITGYVRKGEHEGEYTAACHNGLLGSFVAVLPITQ